MSQQKKNQFLSGIKMVFTDRDLRNIFISLFITGLSVGGFMPYLTVWATNVLGATTFQAGLLFVPMSIVGLIVSFILANISDRVGVRKPFIMATLLVSVVARIPLAFTHSYTVAIVCLAIGGINAFSFFFAYLNDLIAKKPELQSGAGTITGTVRMAFSQGYIFGPLLGSLLIENGGYTILYLITSALALITFIYNWFAIKESKMEKVTSNDTKATGRAQTFPPVLFVVFIAGLLIFAGDSGRNMYFPLYITNTLHQSVGLVGILFTITSVFELVFMPLGGYFSDRIGVKKFFMIGLIFQVVYFILTSMHLPVVGLYVLQILYAFILSATMGVGMVYAQRLAPTQIGLSTTAYMTSIQTSSVVSSLAMGSLVKFFPLPSTFNILAVFTVLAIVIIAFTKEKAKQPSS